VSNANTGPPSPYSEIREPPGDDDIFWAVRAALHSPGLNNRMHGLLLADKPEGMTSNDLVKVVKQRVKPAKVGHSGTLDSAATGLMVILIGAGTRTLDYLDESRKHYTMTAVLGEETDSGDKEGQVTRTADASGITIAQIEEVLCRYRGVLDQIPPHFSAIKKEGVPLYKLARKGVFPELAPRRVELFSLELQSWQPPFLEMDMTCSRGTYARAVVRDIGNDLGVGGRLERLRRTASGPFRVEQALTVHEIVEGGARIITEHLISLADALSHIPEMKVLPAETRKLMRGNSVSVARSRLPVSATEETTSTGMLKVVSADGNLLILVRPSPRDSDIGLRPVKVFNTLEIGLPEASPGAEPS
jgi:tRNA pseudouridine55 synthase